MTGSPGLALCCAIALTVAMQAHAQERQGRLFPPTDLGLLESPDRAAWQKPDLIMDALKIAYGDTVADIGAGSGFFTVRLARRVDPRGENGLVYAEDIQQPMLESIKRRVSRPMSRAPCQPSERNASAFRIRATVRHSPPKSRSR